MFDGFVALEGQYRTAIVVTVDGEAVEPTGTPTYRLYGPDGPVAGHQDQALSIVDTVSGVHTWSPDIDCTAADGFVAGATYTMVVRAVVGGDTLTGGDLIRSFTVT
jgi:hypothetical protein